MSETKKAKAIAGACSIDTVAELICVHRSTVERLLESRKLGFYQVGRRRVIIKIISNNTFPKLSENR